MQKVKETTSTHSGGTPKQRKVRRPNTTKVRVKLQPIESFEKEVEFRAEGPGRVVVRLERLMGSDRVKLTDAKFMSTFLKRLEEEENVQWVERTKSRKKTEQNRSRKLAIEADMQDLYNHPVFRVNKVLQRLAEYDHTMTLGKEIHPPPITPIDPFVYDDSGNIFKNYPGHTDLKLGELSELGSRAGVYQELLDGETPSEQLNAIFIMKENEEIGEYDSEEEEGNILAEPQPITVVDEEQEELDEEEKTDEGEEELELSQDISLTLIQKTYGIPSDEYLRRYEPFRSPLVELTFAEDISDIWELYATAEEVLGVYSKEYKMADDFVNKLSHLM